MIRIIHFVPSLNCTSGISNFLMNYYRRLDHNKFQFDFIYFGEDKINNYKDEINKLGGKYYKICSPVNFLKFKRTLSSILSSYQEKENIIFQNHQIAFTIFLKPIVFQNGIYKFIVHNHMTKFSDKFLSAIRNYILCIPIKYLKNIYFFSCSKEAGEFVYGNNEYIIMNNGIDCKKYLFDDKKRKKIRDNLEISDDIIVIGHIGRFEKVKNHKKIIDVFVKYNEQKNNSKLLLVGTGSLKNKVIDYINKCKINDKVIILENRLDIPDILCGIDYFLFPSKFEGLGIVAIEAQASGIPVIMSNVIPEGVDIINTKRVCLKADNNIWKDAIMSFTLKNIDRKESNDKIFDSIFNIEKNVIYIEKIYSNIIKNGKGGKK